MDSDGREQSYTDAAHWFRKAAEQGHTGAQYNLGMMYLEGNGVEQSDAEAVRWYKMASEQGHARAQYNLGAMYYDVNSAVRNYCL